MQSRPKITRLSWLAVIFTSFDVALASSSPTSRPATQPFVQWGAKDIAGVWQAGASVEHESFAAGEPVWVTVILRNLSPEPRDVIWWRQPIHLCTFVIRRPVYYLRHNDADSPHSWTASASLLEQKIHAQHYELYGFDPPRETVAAGAKVKETYDLASLFDLSVEGDYYVNILVPSPGKIRGLLIVSNVMVRIKAPLTKPAVPSTQPAPGIKIIWGRPWNGLALGVATDKTTYLRGEAIRLTMVTRNMSDAPRKIAVANAYGCAYQINIHLPKGEYPEELEDPYSLPHSDLADLKLYGLEVQQHAADDPGVFRQFTLEPGQSVYETIDNLQRFYDLSLSGKYTITVGRIFPRSDGSGVMDGPRSAAISIEIGPQPEDLGGWEK